MAYLFISLCLKIAMRKVSFELFFDCELCVFNQNIILRLDCMSSGFLTITCL